MGASDGADGSCVRWELSEFGGGGLELLSAGFAGAEGRIFDNSVVQKEITSAAVMDSPDVDFVAAHCMMVR